MPCYTNQVATVELGTKTDAELLRAALESIGVRGYSFDRATGRLTMRGVEAPIEMVKRAYSEAVVTQTAKRNGWQLNWTVNASGNRQAEVLRVIR